MKTKAKKQKNNSVPVRIDKELLAQIRKKAESEQRNIIVVLNRVVSAGLKYEQQNENA